MKVKRLMLVNGVGAVLLAAFVCAGCARADIAPNEEVVFFPTFATLDADGVHWVVPIHGWIFEPEKNSLKRKPLLFAFRKALGVEEEEAKAGPFEDRARMFLVENKEGRTFSMALGGRSFKLNASGENGHSLTTLRLTPGEAAKMTGTVGIEGCRVPFTAVKAEVFFLAPTGVSVVSDIDDTLKVTNVRDRKELMQNAFVRPFVAVKGMPELYRAWAKAGASFHYVSATPWQLYKPLAEFFAAEGIPMGSFHLKYFRWTDSSFFNLFESPEKTKRDAIEPILKLLPKRTFILVGDSGESDPEIYGALAREHPEQISLILIRNIADEPAGAARFVKAFQGVPKEKWQVFTDPAELPGKLPGM
jgi:hypothetical protein